MSCRSSGSPSRSNARRGCATGCSPPPSSHAVALRAGSLAARFAAKEALAKALGAPAGLRWHDAEVPRRAGRPHLEVPGTVAAEPPSSASLLASLAQPRRRHRLRGGRRGGLAGGTCAPYTAAEVRAAEEPLLAALPEGALMQRAAAGLATVAAAARPGLRRRVRCSSAPATTAVTHCTRARGWPLAAPGSRPSCSARPGAPGRPGRPAPGGWPGPEATAAVAGADPAGRPGPRRDAGSVVGRAASGCSGGGGVADGPALTSPSTCPSGVDADTGEVVRNRVPGR